MLGDYASTIRITTLVILQACLSCCIAQNGSLENELVRASDAGLALVTIDRGQETVLKVRYFDKRRETIRLTCCSNPAATEMSSGYVVMVNTDVSRGVLNSIETILGGGQVVVVNTEGKVISSSSLKVISSCVAVDAKAKRFAFLGIPSNAGKMNGHYGIYEADFSGLEPELLLDFPEGPLPPGPNDPEVAIDWSPDGGQIVFSSGKGTIYLLDTATHQARVIAKGWGAHWSPSGSMIAFVSDTNRAVLLDPKTSSLRPVFADREMLRRPLLWSPDGHYLLLSERTNPLIWAPYRYGRLVVYRLSDGARSAIDDYGVSRARAMWIQR